MDLVGPWLPAPPVTSEYRSPPVARITIGDTVPRRPDALPERSITAGCVNVYVDSAHSWAFLDGRAEGCFGFIDLVTLDATLAVTARTSQSLESTTMLLTVSSALLAQRWGRAMMHAAAVVHPATGHAWLLVGD
ncbi:MAG TPA: hypothetical protein VHV78_15745, partial [Gemmatimonadaceae bacterium]|nr:hypothetical protein [Gemmatimonadaceae bacterium]